ncbi:MAG: phosphoribosylformylglycinamidine cyclo-ligase [Pyrodictiaceae archaeon]
MGKKGLTYRDAGVDLDKHRAMHRQALGIARDTLAASKLRIGGLGSYASWFEIDGKRFSLHIDGIGTKTLVLEATRKLWVAGWDCVAMNVNDLAVAGFRPLVLADYIALPGSDEDAFREIIKGIGMAAKKTGVVLIGGETAILPDLAKGYDVVCAVLGEHLGTGYSGRARPGDILVGVESNGLHANGYSLARRILLEYFKTYRARYKGLDLGEELSKPTHIYSNMVLEAIERGIISAAAHITGGAFTKLGRILSDNAYAELHVPEPPRIFRVLEELGGISSEEMYRVFNMGIGLVFAAPEEKLDELRSLIRAHGFNYFVLGRVLRGPPKVVIHTPGGDKVEYKV